MALWIPESDTDITMWYELLDLIQLPVVDSSSARGWWSTLLLCKVTLMDVAHWWMSSLGPQEDECCYIMLLRLHPIHVCQGNPFKTNLLWYQSADWGKHVLITISQFTVIILTFNDTMFCAKVKSMHPQCGLWTNRTCVITFALVSWTRKQKFSNF